MKHQPERKHRSDRLPLRRKRTTRVGKQPPHGADGVHTSTHACKPISTSATAPLPIVRSADVAVPPKICPPGKPDVLPLLRPRSPSSPPFRLPPFPYPERPDVAVERPGIPNGALNASRQALVGGDTVWQLKELVDLRGKDIGKRITLKTGVKDIVHQWQHAENTLDSFMKACSTLMATIPSEVMDTNPGRNLHEIWRQLKDIAEHVKIREMSLGTSLNDLFQLENKLATKEGKVYEKLHSIVGGGKSDAEDDGEYFETEHFTAMSAPSATSSTSSPSIAHIYYSHVGDMNLLKEEIFNFDSEHRRQEFIREAQSRAEQPVEPSDQVFFQNFLDGRAALVHQYISAKEKMEEIRDSCVRQGVKVQLPNLPPFLDHSFRIERSLRDYPGPYHEEKSRQDVSLRDERADNRHRIAHWVWYTRVNKSIHLPEKDTWDSLSENTGPHTVEWTDQLMENDLAFSRYDQLVLPTSVTDDNEEARRPGKPGPEAFPGNAPPRRCSTPALPTYLVQLRLQESTMERTPEGLVHGSSRSCRSCVLGRSPNSALEPLASHNY